VSLIAENLGVDYGGGEVVRGVDLLVNEGELVALVGPNGAGKTSLLRAIMGLSPMSRGTIKSGDSQVERKSPDARTRLGLVLVPEDRGLFPAMSVLDHLWMGMHHRPRKDDLDEVFELFPPLQSRQTQKAGSLSGGEAQMLAIATALLLKPKTLLIDELSFGLAPIVVADLLTRCELLAHRDGIGLLVVEQFVDLILEVADRAMVMSHGEIRVSGSAAEIKSNPELLRETYLG
jgi:branched-chain amino acid transport system ATP-binding protein